MGLFLYATGTSRLVIDVFSQCGLSTSYSSILDAHGVLAKSLLNKAAELAKGPHMLGFDNVQISMSKHITQRPSANLTVTSYTAGIFYALRNATLAACLLRPILERRATCEIINYKQHILLSGKEKKSFLEHLKLDVIEILFRHTEGFLELVAYQDVLKHEAHRPPPPGYKTIEVVLPTKEFDESTTAGVIYYLDDVCIDGLTIPREVFDTLAIISINDQLTNSRVRAAYMERRGDVSVIERKEPFILGPGMFHTQMNYSWDIRFVHSGRDDVPGSLKFWSALLGTKRVDCEKPDYYTLTRHFMNILAGNILHLWSKETGFEDLGGYAETNPSLEELKAKAEEIIVKFASGKGLEKYREDDPLLHNVILLNRDLLYLYELNSAVSSGDFGRLELMLGILTRMFNGAGAKNYSLELLHFIQNLKIAWPEDFA